RAGGLGQRRRRRRRTRSLTTTPTDDCAAQPGTSPPALSTATPQHGATVRLLRGVGQLLAAAYVDSHSRPRLCDVVVTVVATPSTGGSPHCTLVGLGATAPGARSGHVVMVA